MRTGDKEGENVCSGMVIKYGQDGYPEIKYARGVQKDRGRKVHRYTQEKKSWHRKLLSETCF